MIAADTGHRYVDEMEFVVNDESKWREILASDGVVVQSPGMLVDLIDDPPPGIFVVLMRRSLEAIHASAGRIGWEEQFRGNTIELRKFGRVGGDSARLKYEYWEQHPKPFSYLEIEYESLRSHPLFVADDLRRTFGPLQTEP